MKNKNFKKAFYEFTLIVFSVLFALFINEMRNNFIEKKNTQTLIENIKLEIKTNKEFASDLSAYHKNCLKRIRNAYNQDSLESVFFEAEVFEIGTVAPSGIIQGDFKHIAWDVAVQEKISSRIDFETSKILFEVYNQQQTVNATIDNILNIISTREALRKNLLLETFTLFGMEMQLLHGQEEYLLNKYNEALEALNN